MIFFKVSVTDINNFSKGNSNIDTEGRGGTVEPDEREFC
jgi:hypothetical protein